MVIYVFGFIFEGFFLDKLIFFVNFVFNFMLSVMKDVNNYVKDIIVWMLGRIFEFFYGFLFEFLVIILINLFLIIVVFFESINDIFNVVEKVCGVIYFLV